MYVVTSIKLLKLKLEIEKSVKERRYYSRDWGSKYSHLWEVISQKVSVVGDATEVQTKGVSFHCFPLQNFCRIEHLVTMKLGSWEVKSKFRDVSVSWSVYSFTDMPCWGCFLSVRSCELALFPSKNLVWRISCRFPILGQGRRLGLSRLRSAWQCSWSPALPFFPCLIEEWFFFPCWAIHELSYLSAANSLRTSWAKVRAHHFRGCIWELLQVGQSSSSQ